jgi:hypothetical protein
MGLSFTSSAMNGRNENCRLAPAGQRGQSIIEVRTTPTLLHDLTRDHLAGLVRGLNQITIPSDEDKSFASRETMGCASSSANCAKRLRVDPTRPRILLTELGIGYRVVQ